ncbi:MAG: metalloregulator ArsR/SmtB family transcription factor [Pseudomonadota bacterium]
MKEKDALAMLGALSQETRLHIVRYLVSKDAQGASAGDVGEKVGASSSRASFHLSALENSGLITSERVSRQIVYRADIQKIGNLMSFLLDDCCDGHPDIRKCCNGKSSCC